MEDYYKILGVSSSATSSEIRRAYRILARRYHPDVNPSAGSSDRFHEIAKAYKILIDESARRDYDFERANMARSGNFSKILRAEQTRRHSNKKPGLSRADFERLQRELKKRVAGNDKENPAKESFLESLKVKTKSFLSSFGSAKKKQGSSVSEISVIELSLSIAEAINGVKRTIEIGSDNKKLAVAVPAGVRTGSVIRLRNRQNVTQEIVLVIRVASHPFISIDSRGLVIEIPISIREAVLGASIKVPTLDGSQSLRIPPNTQSGHLLRIKSQGPVLGNGDRGDLIYRLQVFIPEASNAVGIGDKLAELEQYYSSDVRKGLPERLSDLFEA
jgi:DnaJ-class molecular chaperone